MEVVRLVLAAAGILAALYGAIRAGLRLLGHAAEGLVAVELERARARRGDLTGVGEAREEAGRARRGRARAAFELGGWSVLLVAPTFTSAPAAVYAVLSVLWGVHWVRERHR